MAKNPDESGKKVGPPRRPDGTLLPGMGSLNPAGRPPGSVDPLKEIGRKIAESRMQLKMTVAQRRELQKAGLLDDDTTLIEQVMALLATSSNPVKIQMFMERLYGKVANVNVNQNSQFDFMKHANKFTDAELESIKVGADPLDILFAKLPDVNEKDE